VKISYVYIHHQKEFRRQYCLTCYVRYSNEIQTSFKQKLMHISVKESRCKPSLSSPREQCLLYFIAPHQNALPYVVPPRKTV
jgi:hypothetical protein